MDLRKAVELVHQSNSIVLFGSGFSTASLNRLNQPMPTGTALATVLATKLGIPDKYPLTVVVGRYLDKFGSTDLTALLVEIFSAKTISPDQARVAALPWRRIYTLNYDDIVERIYSDLNQPLKVINPWDPVKGNDGPRQCVHLHGELHTGKMSASELVLSAQSYNSTELNTGWFSTFRSDAEIADSIIVVGCSMADLHLSSLFFRDPTIKAKTSFVEREDIDEVWSDNLAMYGTVFPIGLKKFADLIANVGSPAPVRRDHPITFDTYELPSSPRAASGSDVFDLVFLGETKRDIIPGTRKEDRLDYILWRDDLDALMKASEASDEPIRCVLHSDLGNGKSIAVDALRAAFAKRGYNVLTLKSLRDIIAADVPFLQSLTGRVVIFVEGIFATNNRRDLTSLVEQFPRFSFIGTCRTSVYELQGHELHLILGKGYQDFDLNYLSDTECDRISDWFDRNGLWGTDASAKPEEKLAILKKRGGREFRSILLDRFKSPFIRDKIESTFKSIPDGPVKQWLLFVLIMDLSDSEPNPRLIRELIGFSLRDGDLEAAGSLREFIGGDGYNIRVRSPVLASVLVSEMYDAAPKVAALVRIAKACDTFSNGRDFYADLIKVTYRPALLIQLFGGTKGYINSVKALFDELKEIPSLARKSLFWLQYAVVLTNEREYFGARVIFETAFGQAKASDFDTFQVDNHYARFLLESRMFAPDAFPDGFWAFVEAHKRLRSQILRDRGSTHPYRVAELYPEFAELVGARFDAGQKATLRRSLEEMRTFLETAPTRYRAQKVRETRDGLSAWLDRNGANASASKGTD